MGVKERGDGKGWEWLEGVAECADYSCECEEGVEELLKRGEPISKSERKTSSREKWKRGEPAGGRHKRAWDD